MGSTLTVDNIVGATTAANVKMPAGATLQVVSAALSTGVSFDTTTGTSLNMMTLNITPKYATSKILVIANIGMYMNSSSNEVRGEFFIKRDSTLIRGREGSSGSGYFRDSSGHFKSMMSGFNHLDSPATTSQINYKLGWRGMTHAVGGQFVEDYTSLSLMEISV